MRNPGETSEPRVESEPASEACVKETERDACSSPPCKRLKQAVLPFSTLHPSPLTSPGSSTSILPQSNSTSSNSSENKPFQTLKETPKVTGGLVTGAPSPPDVKENVVTPQPTPDPAKVSKSLVLENGAETSCRRNTSSCSSPEANSCSCEEDELMITDHSPPAKNKVSNSTPLLKSAEKQKRKEERDKEKLEKQRLREEKQKEKQEAKALKEKERLEAKRKRDQERQEKQAEKERKEKERVEKKEKEEKERLEKKEKRDEERRKKGEEKSAKVEEKRKREAEKRSIEEEQERKRQKIQESFANFFTKSSTVAPKVVVENNSRFKPFEIKAGMSLAPVIRKQLTLDTKMTLDKGFQQQEFPELYLKELERRKPIPKYTKHKLSTIAEHTESSSDAIILDDPITIDENSNSSIEIIDPKKDVSAIVGLKCKLLQFQENYRPAYFGTWRKKSRKISPRNPLKKDTELLDYEMDSDDEWEEEEPGESLSNSEGEDEVDGEEDNDDEDGFFVPHGYLSDDEGVEEEDMEDGICEEKDEKGENSKTKKDQQLAKAKAWEAEMKRKCKPIKPVTVGCLWLEEALLNLTLKRFAACLLVDGPIQVESSSTSSRNNEAPIGDSPNTSNSGALYVPDEAMPELIQVIHGNTAGMHKIMSLFRKQWTSKCLGRDVSDEEVDENCPISKRQLEKKIQNIATKERKTDRLRWYVHNHILAKFGLENLVVADGLNIPDASVDANMVAVSQHTNTPSIKQFVRPVSPALHKATSPELKHSIPKIIPVSSPQNSTSPMEVECASPALTGSHCQQPAQGSRISCVENSHLYVENSSNIGNTSQICYPALINDTMTTAKTTSNTSQESTSQNIETVY